MAELTGQTFAGYEIVAKLGEGGMGAVYKAKQPVLNRFVALKTMAAHLGGDKDFVARFQREAASAATLDHSNVVRVHTAGEADGTHYIVMEFVDGESVRKRLDREGRIPPAEALAITIYVAQALQYAWNEAKLIHRDIKPDNIFISKKGEVKVGDLGLAKSLATEGTEMTATGMAMGSPHYISPEQATGLKDIDFRTDIYSLGCTLYHMLTGQTPYKGDSSMIVMMKHVNDPPPAIFKAWPQCPMPLGMLVGRMLAKDRNARPKSYEQLVADLFAMSEKLQQAAAAPAPPPVPVVTSKPAVVETTAAATQALAPSSDAPTVALQSSAKPKSPVAIYAAAGVAAVLALGGLFIWSPWSKPSTQDSNTPSLQHSAAENWQDWIAESRRAGTMPKDFNDEGGASLCPKAGTALTLAKSIRNGALKATYTLPKADGAQVVFEMRTQRSDKNSYGVAIVAAHQHVFAYRAEQGQIKRIATETLPSEFDPMVEMTFEFRIVGDELSCKLNGQTVLTCRDSTLNQEGAATIRCTSPGIRISRIEVLNLDGVSTFLISSDAAPKQLGNVYKNAVGAEMVYIPPGEFMLGSTKEERAWAMANGLREEWVRQEGEAPRKATIKQGFWMGRTEVTVGQWKQFVAATGYLTNPEKKGHSDNNPKGAGQKRDSEDSATWKDPNYGFEPQDSYPVSCINWNDAQAFCEWLTERERKAGWLPAGLAVRLPTEAEWEYACRAGTQTKFWWGDSKEDGQGRLNCLGKNDGFESAAPVDSFGARGRNRFGLADMLGNVWEWCLDEFDMTQAHEVFWTGNPSARVLRGGSFFFNYDTCRCAGRANYPPSKSRSAYGFRLVVGVGVTGGSNGVGSASADAGWQNAINLLPLIDPQKDAVAGTWTIEQGELISSQDNYARIEMPYQPSEEYDYRVEFSSPGRNKTGPVQLLSKAGREFRWQCFVGNRKICAFESVGGKTVHESPARAEMPLILQNDRRYVSLVEVRNGVVRGYLDGKLCVEWKTNYADMDIPSQWKLHTAGLLGVGSQMRTVFHRIEVREVTGKGRFTRGAPNAPSTTPPLQRSNPPAAWLSAFCTEVAALPAEQQVARVVAKLKELNPGYDGKEEHNIEKEVVTELKFSTIAVADISPVRALQGLRVLLCEGKYPTKGSLENLSPLEGLKLEEIRCDKNPIRDLSPLKGMPLTCLYISSTLVRDLTPLNGMLLERLNCNGTPIADLSPLIGAPLQTCLCAGSRVKELSPLKGMRLTNLHVAGARVSNIDVLRDMPLETLNCDFAPSRDTEILRSIKTLNKINNLPAAEFWKKVEAGEAPQAK